MYTAPPFDGETPAARASTPPRFSSQVLFIRSHLTMTAGDAAETTQHNNNTMASPRGPGPTITPREFRLILSGIPLSLTIHLSERGGYPKGLTKLPGRDGGMGPLGNAATSGSGSGSGSGSAARAPPGDGGGMGGSFKYISEVRERGIPERIN